MTEKISPMDSKRWTHKKKKAVIPVMLAGILLCASSVGLGFAFTGGFFDSHDGGNIPVHEVSVNSEKGIEFDAKEYDINLDTESVKQNKTVWFFSDDNENWTISADKKTATVNLDLIELDIKGDDGLKDKNVYLNVAFPTVTKDCVAISLDGVKVNGGEATEYTEGMAIALDENASAKVVLVAKITITAPALDNTGFPEGTPAFGWTSVPSFVVDKMTLRVTVSDKVATTE